MFTGTTLSEDFMYLYNNSLPWSKYVSSIGMIACRPNITLKGVCNVTHDDLYCMHASRYSSHNSFLDIGKPRTHYNLPTMTKEYFSVWIGYSCTIKIAKSLIPSEVWFCNSWSLFCWKRNCFHPLGESMNWFRSYRSIPTWNQGDSTGPGWS